jgi:NAD/NADP transhydrogenase beta subunit
VEKKTKIRLQGAGMLAAVAFIAMMVLSVQYGWGTGVKWLSMIALIVIGGTVGLLFLAFLGWCVYMIITGDDS